MIERSSGAQNMALHGGPLDCQQIVTDLDVLRLQFDAEPGVEHVYRAVRLRPFSNAPGDYFQYDGERASEPG